jgi:hypothetical protein
MGILEKQKIFQKDILKQIVQMKILDVDRGIILSRVLITKTRVWIGIWILRGRNYN